MASLGKNVSAGIGAAYALASTAVTAGGSGDATQITGTTINTASALTAPAIYPKDFNSVRKDDAPLSFLHCPLNHRGKHYGFPGTSGSAKNYPLVAGTNVGPEVFDCLLLVWS